jgi:hypothetical protein
MTLASKTLVALAISSTAFVAFASDSEARFRAKYGRSTPAVEAQQANTAYRDAQPASKTGAPADNWAEQRHQTKLGRATPAEEARIQADKANTAYREVKAPAEDRWYDSFLQKKYGRSTAPKK